MIQACLYSDQPTIQAKLKELKPELPILLSTGFVYVQFRCCISWDTAPTAWLGVQVLPGPAVNRLVHRAGVAVPHRWWPRAGVVHASRICKLLCAALRRTALTQPSRANQWGHLSVPSLRNRGYLLPFAILIAVLLLMRLVPYVEEGLIGDWGDGALELRASSTVFASLLVLPRATCRWNCEQHS